MPFSSPHGWKCTLSSGGGHHSSSSALVTTVTGNVIRGKFSFLSSPAFSTTSPSSASRVSPASAAAFAAPSRTIRSRSSWSTMTWQARSFST